MKKEGGLTQIEKFYAACRELGIDDEKAFDRSLRAILAPSIKPKPDKDREPA